jgi:histidinol phosphatase-like PHP family hydrolase
MKLKYNTKYEKYWTSEKEQRSVLTGIEADIDISMSEIDYLVNMKDHIEYSYDMYDAIFAIVHKIRKSITGED